MSHFASKTRPPFRATQEALIFADLFAGLAARRHLWFKPEASVNVRPPRARWRSSPAHFVAEHPSRWFSAVQCVLTYNPATKCRNLQPHVDTKFHSGRPGWLLALQSSDIVCNHNLSKGRPGRFLSGPRAEN